MITCSPCPLKILVTKWSQLSGLLQLSLVLTPCMTIWAILDSNQWPLACRARGHWLSFLYVHDLISVMLQSLIMDKLQLLINSGDFCGVLLITLKLTTFDDFILIYYISGNQSEAYIWSVRLQQKECFIILLWKFDSETGFDSNFHCEFLNFDIFEELFWEKVIDWNIAQRVQLEPVTYCGLVLTSYVIYS